MTGLEGAAPIAAEAGAGVMEKASLEVKIDQAALSEGPVRQYEAVYTRGGWIWRTSHRFREWLALKDSLKKEFGTRNLPDEATFPKKEDMGAVVVKLLSSCQGCNAGAGKSCSVMDERRLALQAYFSEILVRQRQIWDTSEAIKAFFFPGPPTSYSTALARRRSDEVKREKSNSKEGSSATGKSSLSSTIRSLKFSSIFESTPSPKRTATTPPAATTPSASASASSVAPSSMMSMISAKLPSLRDVLFDDAPVLQTSSRHGAAPSTPGVGSSRHGGSIINGSQHSSTGGFGKSHPPSAWISKSRSESGATSDGHTDSDKDDVQALSPLTPTSGGNCE